MVHGSNSAELNRKFQGAMFDMCGIANRSRILRKQVIVSFQILFYLLLVKLRLNSAEMEK